MFGRRDHGQENAKKLLEIQRAGSRMVQQLTELTEASVLLNEANAKLAKAGEALARAKDVSSLLRVGASSQWIEAADLYRKISEKVGAVAREGSLGSSQKGCRQVSESTGRMARQVQSLSEALSRCDVQRVGEDLRALTRQANLAGALLKSLETAISQEALNYSRNAVAEAAKSQHTRH